jgi:DNA topoisomerase-1
MVRLLHSPPSAARSASKPSHRESVAVENIEAAKSAGLRYVTDESPGIRRLKSGKAFRYRHDDGTAITDEKTLWRIKRLAIPPAWTDVWICPRDDGHIQATGRDARGRKQYRYHPDWRAVRDETKYERTIAFGEALPRIRERVATDLRRPGLGRRKVLATMVRLLESTLVRVGNEEYAKANGSIGLSTMRDQHVRVERGTMLFSFKGKSGKRHRIELHEPRLAEIVRQVQDLPGQELFQYIDREGRQQKVTSDDVNAYLRDIAGADFSAKDFRTWAGTVLAAMALAGLQGFSTKKQAKKNMVSAIERVAEQLGNTPAVCRKCYIHPAILNSYLDGTTVEVLQAKADDALTAVQQTSRRSAGRPALAAGALNEPEKAVLKFLRDELHRREGTPTLAQALERSVRKPKSASRRSQGDRTPQARK